MIMLDYSHVTKGRHENAANLVAGLIAGKRVNSWSANEDHGSYEWLPDQGVCRAGEGTRTPTSEDTGT